MSTTNFGFGVHLPRQTAESTEAFLRKEIRRLQGLVDRRAKLDAEIIQILQVPTHLPKDLRNAVSRVLNLLKLAQ